MAGMYIKVGDTRPWSTVLTSVGDDNLTDIASSVLYMRAEDGSTNKIDGSAAVVGTKTATTAALTYSPTSDDVDTPGEYRLYWKVTFTTGSKTAAFPSNGFDRVVIGESFE